MLVITENVDKETDICMRHDIELKVTFTDMRTGDEELEEFSSPAFYNAERNVENLYSGLLRRKVFDKICEKTNGDHSIPSVPNAVQRCITKSFKIESGSKEINFEILNPLGRGRTPITGHLERLDKCNSTQPSESVGEFDQTTILPIIIGTSVLFLLLVSIEE